jgi:hypothetical protein
MVVRPGHGNYRPGWLLPAAPASVIELSFGREPSDGAAGALSGSARQGRAAPRAATGAARAAGLNLSARRLAPGTRAIPGAARATTMARRMRARTSAALARITITADLRRPSGAGHE